MLGNIRLLKSAPHFVLEGVQKSKRITFDLNNYKEKWVLLYFYPSDFHPENAKELKELQRLYPQFLDINVELASISVDQLRIHEAWLKDLGKIDFAMLADIHHIVSIDYNVFHEEKARSHSAVFIINPEQNLEWFEVNNIDKERSIVRLLEKTKEVVRK